MPSIDLTPYYQPQGSTSDGTKYDNGLALIQSTLNALDNNNIAAAAAVAASKLAGIATVLGTQNVGSANTDLQGPGASRSDLYIVTTGTGTLRSIGAPTENGSRVVIRNASGSSITLKHQLAGGAGAQLFMRTVADVTLLDKELVEFVYDGTNWVEMSRDQPASGAVATTYRKTTVKAVNTTVAETDLLNGEITVGAGVIGSTGVVRLVAWGDWLNTSASTVAAPRLRLKLGAVPTTVIDIGTPTAAASSATRMGWRVVVEIMNLSATNVQSVSLALNMTLYGSAVAWAAATGEGAFGMSSGGATGPGAAFGQVYNSAAIDTTASMAIQLTTVNGSASASYETKLVGAFVQIL